MHRPIFFYGKESIPSGKQELSILDREKYWGSHFLRDTEEVRSLNYPHLSDTEKEHYESSWRFIVKMILDKNRYRLGSIAFAKNAPRFILQGVK